jgi:hypothetical protein
VPAAKPSVSPTDRHVFLLARIVQKHEGTPHQATLGSVKAEKIAHLVEAMTGIDLGREPLRDAAGPVDYPHLRKVFHRAEKLFAFQAVARQDHEGYRFKPQSGLGKASRRLDEVLGEATAEADRIIDFFVSANTQQAEIVATLYAVWNDLLAEGAAPDDSAIIDGFYAWHSSKAAVERPRLEAALVWMREHGFVPTGKAKLSKHATGDAMPVDGEAFTKLRGVLEERKVISSADAQAATGLSAPELRPLLQRLVDEGHATREGKARGTKYRATTGDGDD